MHYGVLVQDFWKGSVIIKRTLVAFNCNFGVYLHQKERPDPNPIKDFENALSIEKAAIEASAGKSLRRGNTNAMTSPFAMNISQNSMLFSTQINKLKRGVTSSALPSTAQGQKSRDVHGRTTTIGGPTPHRQDELGKAPVPG